MNPELEALVKALDAYLAEGEGPEALRLLAIYESRLDDACARTHIPKEAMDRAVQLQHRRWRWASHPGFPIVPPEA